MRPNTLKKKIAEGVRVVGGWVAIPNAFSTEIYAAQGSHAGCTPVGRPVGWNRCRKSIETGARTSLGSTWWET
jgi:hypothetical protein